MVECFTGGKNKETDFVFTVCGTVGLYRIRYDGTGSELIPVLGGLLYPQMTEAISPAVGCHYFPPRAQSITAYWPVANDTAWCQRHRVNQ